MNPGESENPGEDSCSSCSAAKGLRTQNVNFAVFELMLRNRPRANGFVAFRGESAFAAARLRRGKRGLQRDGELGADDGADAGGFGRDMKARRAVDAVTIEQRKRRIPQRRRPLDQCLGQRGATQKGKRRRGMELDVRHDGGPC